MTDDFKKILEEALHNGVTKEEINEYLHTTAEENSKQIFLDNLTRSVLNNRTKWTNEDAASVAIVALSNAYEDLSLEELKGYYEYLKTQSDYQYKLYRWLIY